MSELEFFPTKKSETLRNLLVLPFCHFGAGIKVVPEAMCREDRAYLINANGDVLHFKLIGTNLSYRKELETARQIKRIDEIEHRTGILPTVLDVNPTDFEFLVDELMNNTLQPNEDDQKRFGYRADQVEIMRANGSVRLVKGRW